MIIPLHQLSEEALNNLIAEYCLRDWGLNDCESPLLSRQQQVKAALDNGQLLVLYSQHHESAQIIAAADISHSS